MSTATATIAPRKTIDVDVTATEHTATVASVRTFPGSDTDFVCLIFTDELQAVGELDGDQIAAGVAYRFFGRWDHHERYGTRFRFDSFSPLDSQSQMGAVAFLSRSNLGLLKSDAMKLWRSYGHDAITMLRDHPEKVVFEEVLSQQKAERASAMLRAMGDSRRVTEELFNLFAGRGFPKAAVKACIAAWGDRAPRVIRRDPFKILVNDIPGVGFKRADKLYCDLGHNPLRLKRQTLAAWHWMRVNGSGNTWEIEGGLLKAVLSAAGSFDGAEFVRAVALGVRAGWLARRVGDDGVAYYAERGNAESERRLAFHVDRIRRHAPLWARLDEGESGVTDHQRERIDAFAGSPLGILAGTPGTGKAQPLDAKVLTPTGWKLMGEIEVGDEVVDPTTGKPAIVDGVFDQGEKAIYRVEMSDGSSTECCADHLWLTQTRHSRKNAQRKGRPLFRAGKVRDLTEIMGTLKANDGHANHFIPMTAPVEFVERDLPINPYLLGVLLGNGCFRGGAVTLTAPDTETMEMVCELLPDGVSARQRSRIDFAIRGDRGYQKNAVISYLRSCGLFDCKSETKFIPNEYKFASVESRIAILQGLLDSDGTCGQGYDIEFSSASEQLAEDVLFIVQSLGGKSRISSRVPVYTYKDRLKEGQTNYRLHISLPPEIVPFRLYRKAERYTPRSKYKPSRRIESVELVGYKPARCISVKSESHLYITDDFIVTHNTFTAAALLQKLLKRIPAGRIAVCAPTGKAAVRITEAMQRYNLPLAATTIHRLLGVGGMNGGKWSFLHNEHQPLDECVVVVDEGSMCDTDLAAALFSAIPPGGNVLIVGDPFQLPPVGHGAPLRDMIAAGVPCGLLEEIKRNSGQIVLACKDIKDGKQFAPSSRVNEAEGMNLIHFPAANEDEQQSAVVSLLGALRSQGFDATWDVQVLVATNDKSKVSRKQLNAVMQQVLNAQDESVPPAERNPKFRPGDKVICLKNTEIRRVELESEELAGAAVEDYRATMDNIYLANGDMGRIMAVNATSVVALFTSPNRLVKITTKRARKKDDGDESTATPEDAAEFDLAYAVTVHKSQGSEFPVAIVIIDESAGPIGCREWIYTAISRASRLCFLVGKMGIALRQAAKSQLGKRKTFLRELIVETKAEATDEG